MTTPQKTLVEDRLLLQRIDEALDLPAGEDPLGWLLARLPVEQHPRAARMLSMAQTATGDNDEASRLIVDTSAVRWVGQRIGPYELISLIGEGGMGQVFLAERVDGEFSQRVAIKVIRGASLTAKTIGQFQSERQILADLQHPNIARLLDGGATDQGLPYVVMEFVDGEPLDLYLQAHELSLNARLELFIDVCAAVEHAHRALVIHRDIKPSNILVTKQGVPKLLDFGIAKSIAQRDADATVDGRVLTPSYASPEQVKGDVLTTSTDVYSLGIVLYQCLAGERPYETTSLTPAEYERVVTEHLPTRPSARLRDRDQPEWTKLSGDLDAIVMRALAKEPERRYASAVALADDIRRHLAHLPVSAQPDTLGYRLSRFVRRRRGWVVAGVLMSLSLAAAFGMTLMQYRVALAERERAEQRFEQARTLAQSMFNDVYDKLADVQGTLVARESLANSGVAYLDELSSDPTANDDLLLDLGRQYSRLSDVYGGLGIANLGQLDVSWELLLKAESMIERLLTRQPDSVDAVSEMLWIKRLQTNQLLSYQIDSASARKEIVGALEMAERVRSSATEVDWALESRYWNARTDYIKVLLWDNDHQAALPVLNSYLDELDRPELDGKLRNVAGKRSYFRSQRAELHQDAKRYSSALPDWEAAFAHISKSHAENPEVSYFMIQRHRYAFNLAQTHNGLENWEESLRYSDIALQMAERLLALDANDSGTRRNLAAPYETRAAAFAGQENYDQAQLSLKSAEAIYAELLERLPDEPMHQRDMASILYLRGALVVTSSGAVGSHDEACELLGRSVEIWQGLIDNKQVTQYDRVSRLDPLQALAKKTCE